jgi:serine phosphatase RsbU (regulator of sigma subunit)
LQLSQEIARAAAVQAELLPTEQPSLAGFEIGARCLPASAVGGDFYDWQQLANGTLTFTVGDVMGKGMSAALLMATTRAVIRAMAAEHGPAAAVRRTAAALDGDLARSGTFVTLFHAQLDVETAVLRYVDAGHGQVFLRRANGTIETLQPWGLPIGVASTEDYHDGSVTLGYGDLLVIYSDGLSEARPDLFRNQATLAAQISSNETASETAQRLVELATAAGPLPDDLTVVAVRRPFVA